MVKIEKDNSISIRFGEGIGNSLFSDFSDALGVNLDNLGILSTGYKFNKLTETKSSKNFVITSAGNDYFTLSPVDLTLHRQPVKLTTTGTLPTGLNTTDIYYLWDVNSNGTDFRFCESLAEVGTSYINLSDTGTGTHSFTVQVPQIVKGYTFDSYSNLYLLDGLQRVWFSQSSSGYQSFYLLEGNTSSGAGNGIMFYAGFILVFGNAKIDALAEINDVADTLTWTNDFVSGSISNSAVYPSKGAVPFYSQYDNAIYFSNGIAVNGSVYRVALLEENVGQDFNPTDIATFSFVADAIELPFASGTGYVQSINELGEYIILGTYSNTIYYWDRKSLLPTYVVNMPENNTTDIIVKGSSVFAFNGYNGKFYQITTNDYGEVLEIPEHLFNIQYTNDGALTGDRINIEYTYATLFLDEILFAIEVNGKAYVMSYNIKTKTLTKKNISSYGETLTDSATVGRIYQIINLSKTQTNKNDVLISTSKRASSAWSYALEGYQSGSSSYPHKVYDNDEAYVVTGLISYGEDYIKKTLRELQVSLTRALTTGQSVKVYYRLDDNSAWTLLKTISYTLNGAIKDTKTEALITDIKDLQIKIVVNGYNTANYTGTTPYLKLIRLIP